MAKFKDRKGTEWTVEITFGHLKGLKADHGLDLNDALDQEAGLRRLGELIEDKVRLVALLWFLCEEQAGERKVGPEQFGLLLSGGSLREALSAVVGAVFDFFQGPASAATIEARCRATLAEKDERVGDLAGKLWDQEASKLFASSTPASAG